MADKSTLRTLANALKRVPWLVTLARLLWGLSRARFTAGVVAVIINDQGAVLLVEHVFHPHTPWGLPGGWIERREEPVEALRRELREELGLEVRIAALLLSELGYGDHIDLAYLCYPSNAIGRLSAELLAYRWVEADQLPRVQKFHYHAIQHALEVVSRETK
ncbi:MAG: NUDIX hydrolase [Chloroflexi bacterium]|nr:NUDIX hydrolase [Chloroflexota bacterium]